MATINRYSLMHHLRTVAERYTADAAAMSAVHAQLAEQFGNQAKECTELADALEAGEPLRLEE